VKARRPSVFAAKPRVKPPGLVRVATGACALVGLGHLFLATMLLTHGVRIPELTEEDLVFSSALVSVQGVLAFGGALAARSGSSRSLRRAAYFLLPFPLVEAVALALRPVGFTLGFDADVLLGFIFLAHGCTITLLATASVLATRSTTDTDG
jgi:hypothetical protein